jgi:hypothetical protein
MLPVVSRTSSIGFRGRRLWAHTEGLQVLSALMVEAAGHLEARDERWLQALVEQWRVQASVRDLGCALDDSWSSSQVSLIKDMIDSVRRELREPMQPAGFCALAGPFSMTSRWPAVSASGASSSGSMKLPT